MGWDLPDPKNQPNSLEETRLVTKIKVPKSVPRTVDGEPPGLGRKQWELEGVAHENENCLSRVHLTL